MENEYYKQLRHHYTGMFMLELYRQKSHTVSNTHFMMSADNMAVAASNYAKALIKRIKLDDENETEGESTLHSDS